MTGPTFVYRGRDLVKPLTALLMRHDADLRLIAESIAKHLPADIEAARAAPSLTARKQTSGELTVRRLDGERIDLLVKRRETELFLQEAKRTPRHRWTLTMRELAELYPLPRGER